MKSKVKPIIVLAATLFAGVLFFSSAGAVVYDDFTTTGIDTDRWTATGTGVMSGFTQPGDNYLHYSGSTPVKDKLTSTMVFTSGIFTMPFADYTCDNSAPPARGLGSVAAIGLGSRNTNRWVRIERGQIQPDPMHGIIGGYIEVNWVLPSNPNKIYVNYVQSDITSGLLQIRYDGKKVTFFYRASEEDPWAQMVITGQGGKFVLDALGKTQPLVIEPGWTEAVPMFIEAIPGGDDSAPSYTLSFKVDYVGADRLPIDCLNDIIASINDIEIDYFKNKNRQKALINKLDAVVKMVEQGSYTSALRKIQRDILQKAEGCSLTGQPDRSDWITDCNAQANVYQLILETISALERLI